MDYNALQHKLFSMDPSDPADDLRKLQAQAGGGNAPESVPETLEVINETAQVPEGSLQLDKNYSVNDFAKLAGVTETQKTGSEGQAKGKDPMPEKSKPTTSGETPHPLKDKLVGEAEEDRITALERRIDALEEMLSERELSKPEEKEKERLVKGMKKNTSDFKKRYGKDAKAVMYATATKNAKANASIDTSNIKNRLYDALNKKMGI